MYKQPGARIWQDCTKFKKKCVTFKFIPYLHQSVSTGTHKRVHCTIKRVVMRIAGHMTYSFICGKGGRVGSVKYKIQYIIDDLRL